jgi:hypothetical protein
MELSQSLIIYAIIVTVLIIVLSRQGIRATSATVISLIVGQVLLNLMKPPHDINLDTDTSSAYALYFLIQLGTPLVTAIYAIAAAWKDRTHS